MENRMFKVAHVHKAILRVLKATDLSDYNKLGKAYFVAGFLNDSFKTAERRGYLANQTGRLMDAGMDETTAAQWTGQLIRQKGLKDPTSVSFDIDRTNIWLKAYSRAQSIVRKYQVESFTADDVISSMLVGVSVVDPSSGSGIPAPYDLGKQLKNNMSNATPQSVANLLAVQAQQQTEQAASAMKRRRDQSRSTEAPLTDGSALTWGDLLTAPNSNAGISFDEVLSDDGAVGELIDLVDAGNFTQKMKDLWVVALLNPEIIKFKESTGQLILSARGLGDVLKAYTQSNDPELKAIGDRFLSARTGKIDAKSANNIWKRQIKDVIDYLRGEVASNRYLNMVQDELSLRKRRYAKSTKAKRVLKAYLSKTSGYDWEKAAKRRRLGVYREKYPMYGDATIQFWNLKDGRTWEDVQSNLNEPIYATLEVLGDSYQLFTGNKSETFQFGEESVILKNLEYYLK